MMCACVLSHFIHVSLCGNLWTVAGQAHFSMGFSRQEYWNLVPFPSSGDPPNPEIESVSLLPWQADSLPGELLVQVQGAEVLKERWPQCRWA